MKGKDVRCPECGSGLVDVAPDYDLGGDGASWLYDSISAMWTEGTCANGHKLMMHWARTPPRDTPAFEVSVR